MGFALPGAISATFAHPGKRVVAIAGDAGFLMNVQDLETLPRHNADMVWVDGAYGLIEWKHQNQFDDRHSDLTFNNPDFELLAKAFGIWGKEVHATEEFAPALDEALNVKGPALLAVPVDYRDNRKLTMRLGDLEFTL